MSTLENSALMLLLAVFVASCGCDENGGGSSEDTASEATIEEGTTTGPVETETGEEDTGCSTDTSTSWTGLEWKWEELPKGEECGVGCRQLVFGNDIGEGDWDVWGDRIIIAEQWGTGIKVIDLNKERTAQISNPYPDMSDGDINSEITYGSPALNEEHAFFELAYNPKGKKDIFQIQFFQVHVGSGETEMILDYDFKNNDRVSKEKHGENYPSVMPGQLDVSNSYLVSVGGCEPFDLPTLCVFDLTSENHTPRTAISGNFGIETMVWNDTAVFRDIRYHPVSETITGVDLKTMKEYRMTDAEKSQIYPRLYEDRLVYMDLRHGDDDPYGDWHNSAVYMKNIRNGETKLIAGKDHIAAFPDINGDIIVWQDYRDCENPNDVQEFYNSEIWGYNIKTGKEFRITNLPGRKKLFPRVWGHRAFIQMSRKDDPAKTSIYSFDISAYTK